MKSLSREKLIFSFLVYSVSLIGCSVLASILLYSHLYGEKVSYLKYPELQKMLKGQPELAKRFVSISKYILPTVVNVTSQKLVSSKNNPRTFGNLFRRFLDSPKSYKSTGSGFVISEEGHIVTNYHVVGTAPEIYVTFMNHKRVRAELVGGDPKTDIALIRIKNERVLRELKNSHAFQVAKLGTSADLQVGEMVLAVGNPFALSHSVSLGIISAKGRSNMGIADYENFIQTDAAVNPGNSGGPLVSVRTGEVIGINTAILSKTGGFQGIAFTIPIDMAKKVIEKLKKTGKVQRGYLGVATQDITPEITTLLKAKHSYGALVRKVYPRSPAKKAKLRSGDLIVEFDGKKIENVQQLRNQVSLTPVGKITTIKIDRKGTIHLFSVTIEGEEIFLRPKKPNFSLGLVLEKITPENMAKYGLNEEKGLLISKVYENSLAFQAGLREGQMIFSVNGKSMNTLEDFKEAIQGLYEGKSLLLEGSASGESFYVILKK